MTLPAPDQKHMCRRRNGPAGPDYCATQLALRRLFRCTVQVRHKAAGVWNSAIGVITRGHKVRDGRTWVNQRLTVCPPVAPQPQVRTIFRRLSPGVLPVGMSLSLSFSRLWPGAHRSRYKPLPVRDGSFVSLLSESLIALRSPLVLSCPPSRRPPTWPSSTATKSMHTTTTISTTSRRTRSTSVTRSLVDMKPGRSSRRSSSGSLMHECPS